MMRIRVKALLICGLCGASELISVSPAFAQATSANVPVVTLAEARARSALVDPDAVAARDWREHGLSVTRMRLLRAVS